MAINPIKGRFVCFMFGTSKEKNWCVFWAKCEFFPASGPGNALGRHLSRAGHGTSGFAKTNKDLATFAGVPSSKLTWQWKIPMFFRKYIFKWSIFHCHFSLLEGTCFRRDGW